MMVGAKVCNLTEDLLWFVCGLYVGILTSSLMYIYIYMYTHTHTYIYIYIYIYKYIHM